LVLLPRRGVVERDFAWASRFRRLARDYAWLAATLVSLHLLAFACLMLTRFTGLILSPQQALGHHLELSHWTLGDLAHEVCVLLIPTQVSKASNRSGSSSCG
jgi:hypothetical protein